MRAAAIGNCTFHSSWRRVEPADRRGLDGRRRTVADPALDEPDDGRHGVDDRGDDRREPGGAEQREGREQVDERRHRLGRVQERPQDRAKPVVSRGQHAEQRYRGPG